MLTAVGWLLMKRDGLSSALPMVCLSVRRSVLVTGGAAAGGCPTAWWGGIWEAELLPPHLYEYSWGTLGGCERKLRAACGWGRGAAPCFFFPGRSGQPRCCGDRLRTRILPPPGSSPCLAPAAPGDALGWQRLAAAGPCLCFCG